MSTGSGWLVWMLGMVCHCSGLGIRAALMTNLSEHLNSVKSRRVADDEFYTLRSDVDKALSFVASELGVQSARPGAFLNKRSRVLCPCDDDRMGLTCGQKNTDIVLF